MKCPNCGIDKPFNTTILWANAHGEKIRIFCDSCGQWTDKKYLKNKDEITLTVVQKPTQNK